MQQSSQIFVFSTQWANKAAEAVMQGAYSTIICWHENQPETKKHLEVEEHFSLTSYFLEVTFSSTMSSRFRAMM